MTTHDMGLRAFSVLALTVVLCVWLGIAGPLTESFVKATPGEWLGFAGGVLGGLATLGAAFIAWHAVQQQRNDEQAALKVVK